MKIAVIGGGPAGVIAAGFARASGADSVLLIEKNEKICKKLFITGKGRCNITNDCGAEDFLANVVTNPRFLYSAVNAFPPSKTLSFFNEMGCVLKTERGGRVFPLSDKSSDIISVFKKFLTDNNVEIRLNTELKGINANDSGFALNTSGGNVNADKVILCGGGASYPLTGSDGGIFNIIKNSGHTVIPLKPALCPLILKENVSGLAGLSLKNVTVTVKSGGKKVFGGMGEMLFTHEGVSGPLILSASSYLNKYDISDSQVIMDLKPALDMNTLVNRINRDFAQVKNKLFRNSLNELLPKSIIPFIINLSGIDGGLQANSVTAENRRLLAMLLKNLTFNVRRLADIETAIVTSGGVSVKEINPSTMESRLIKGLYFAGEVIDIDALTGGYNIQAAISTGYLAGVSAARK